MYKYYVYSDELYHYGVKGMKWGVRKVDYKSEGLRTNDIYKKISELDRQESNAYLANLYAYKTKKKEYKSDLKSQKKAKKIDRRTYRLKKKQGFAAAKATLYKNNKAIRSDFNEAYHNVISDGEIKAARIMNSNRAIIGSFLGDKETVNSEYRNNEYELNNAESRRREFANDFTMKNYKKK